MTRIATRTGSVAATNAAPVPSDDFQAQVTSWHRSLLAANRSPLTILSYGKATKQLHAFLEGQGMPRSVEHIKREHVEAFVAHLQDSGKAEATVAQHWRSLKAWFNWLAEDDRIQASPMRRMRSPRVIDKEVPVLSAEEIGRLMDHTAGRSFIERRDRALIALFLTTGMRLSEMTGLEYPGDVDLDARLLRLIGKGNQERTAKFSEEAAGFLDRYLVVRAQHPDAEKPALWLGQDGPMTASGIAQAVKRRATAANVDMHVHTWNGTRCQNEREVAAPQVPDTKDG